MIYGLMKSFDSPEDLLAAAEEVRDQGFTLFDAFTPFPIEGLDEAIGFPKNRVALLSLGGGIIGGVGALAMQWYANVIGYPISVAGRPNFSWPAFIPVIFELTVLGAAVCTVFGMLALNRLPQLYHPVFEIEEFRRASKDQFFLCIQAADPKFERNQTQSLLQSLPCENDSHPIWEVPLAEV
jgi:hypothetical protein